MWSGYRSRESDKSVTQCIHTLFETIRSNSRVLRRDCWRVDKGELCRPERSLVRRRAGSWNLPINLSSDPPVSALRIWLALSRPRGVRLVIVSGIVWPTIVHRAPYYFHTVGHGVSAATAPA